MLTLEQPRLRAARRTPDAEPTRDAATEADATATDAWIDAGDGRPLDAASRCVAAPSADYCATLPALPAPPVIDGEPDCELGLTPIEPRLWTRQDGRLPDAPARFAAAWRPEGLYLFVQVDDGERGRRRRPGAGSGAATAWSCTSTPTDAT